PQGTAADGYGHGSFVAQVAAGHAKGAAGAAPKAPIVSLDVMNDDGMALTSDVVAAADWIYTHKDENNVRVANFSLIGSAPSSIIFDPLDRALERLWLSGVVVVTAAGNYAVDGQRSDVPFAPALHPDWTPDQVKGALMLSAAQPGPAAGFALGVGEVDGAAALSVTDPPNPNAALEQFVVPDPNGGDTPTFDAASWGTTAQADASWGTASWGTASWGTASWGTASWGTGY